MKKIISVILIIIIVIIGIFIFNKKQNKFDYNIEQISEYNFFILKENNQYGVINKEGKIIIEAKYTEVIIPNPEKDIFVCYENDEISILNSNNEELFTEYDKVEPIKIKNVASYLNYEKSVLKYKKDDLYGLIDYEGNVITKNKYSKIENLQSVEGKFLVEENSKLGVIDLRGNILVKTEYDNIISDGYYTKEDGYKKSGFIVAISTDNGYKYGYTSYLGKKILDVEFDEVTRITKVDEIKLIVANDEKYGVYENRKRVIDIDYQSILYDENTDCYIAKKNDKYGVISITGKEIINIENDSVEARGKYIYVKNQDENKVYDKEGNQLDINFNRSFYITESEEYQISTILNNNITYYGITDKNDTQLVNETYRYIEYLYKNYFIAKDETGLLGVINSNGRIILNLEYNSVKKIKDRNLLEVTDTKTKTTYIYSEDMQLLASMQNATLSVEDEYILIYNDSEKIYINNYGERIEDTSNIKSASFPNTVGEFKKHQVSLENIYYSKE